MKFSMLPLGARFEFEGKVYTKTGPVAATSESGGQRMIPRYAVLRPLDGSLQAPEVTPKRKLDAHQVEAAFETFYAACGQALVEAVQDEVRLGDARQQLNTARLRFWAALEPGPSQD